MNETKEFKKLWNELFGRNLESAPDAIRRKGVEQGFALAQRTVAKMLREEGYVEMAGRVDRLALSKKS